MTENPKVSKQSLPAKNREKKARYFNRELSWLAFNQRVFEKASLEEIPLLERVRFLGITSQNLDEFFMVRVAGLKRAVHENLKPTDSPDKMTPSEVLRRITGDTREYIQKAYEEVYPALLKQLKKHQIKIQTYKKLTKSQQATLTDYFYQSVFPVLTPLAVDSAHPFPFLSNTRLYLLISFEAEKTELETPPVAFVEIPEVLPRLVRVPSLQGERDHDPDMAGGQHSFILLEDLVAQNLDSLFLGFYIKNVSSIRVTRDLDFSLLENDVVDLLKSVQKEVKNREQAAAVRLEITDNISKDMVDYLKHMLKLRGRDLYFIPGPIDLSCLQSLYDLPLPDLKFHAFNPRLPPQLKSNKEIFSLIREQDLLIHHPYESFYAVIEFLNSAAADPKVLAIKQTLYRTSGDSPIIDALIRAAENGKHVTAVVELKARFDEKNNIIWARQMERSGVNVVYGFIGLKTHCKTTLIVRQEGQVLRRYVHLSTGNYNSATAKSYVDLAIVTADQDIGNDISILFNLLTGFNVFTETSALSNWVIPEFSKIVVSPLTLRQKFIHLIRREVEAKKQGKKARIIGKMNALVDRHIIEELYKASAAGVKIDLIVRGICCLKPGVLGVSENIKVTSIVDRFLEHSRIYYFHAGGKEEVYLSSADWMPRNMERRVEILFPILDKNCQDRIINEILETYLSHHVKAKTLDAAGNYSVKKTRKKTSHEISAQERFIEIARESGLKLIPYEMAIRHKQGRRPLYKKVSSKNVLRLKKKKDKDKERDKDKD